MRAILKAVARALAAMAKTVVIAVVRVIDGVVHTIRTLVRAPAGPDFEIPAQEATDGPQNVSVALADEPWEAVRSAAASFYSGGNPEPSTLGRMPTDVDRWLGQLTQEQMYVVASTPKSELEAFFKGYMEIDGLPLPSHVVERNRKVQSLINAAADRRRRESSDALIATIEDPDGNEYDEPALRYAGV